MLQVPFFIFGTLLALAILADVITTHIGIKLGAKEAHPFYAWFKYPAVLVAFVGVIVVVFVWWGSSYNPLIARIFCLFFAVFRGFFAYRNYKLIQKIKKG